MSLCDLSMNRVTLEAKRAAFLISSKLDNNC